MQQVANRVAMSPQDFKQTTEFTIHWLGSGSVLLNYYGTTILIDPVLDQIEIDGQLWNKKGDLPMFQLVPIHMDDVSKVDAILYTHADEDHIGSKTFQVLAQKGSPIFCPAYVKEKFVLAGVEETQITVVSYDSTFQIGEFDISCTKALHDWPQRAGTEVFKYNLEDCVGYYMKTPSHSLWYPGDSKLLDEHLQFSSLDVLFIDYADDPYHFGFDNAVMLSNHYKNAKLFAIHWGTFQSKKPALNGNPFEAQHWIEKQERLVIPSIGGKFCI